MNAATSRGLRKGTRDLLQAIAAVAASGGTVALIDLIAGSVNPSTGVILAFVFKVLFAFLQNWAETAGKIPTILPTPAIVPAAETVDAVVADVAGTVDAVVDEAGNVVGEVTDTAGTVVGEVTGSVVEPVEEIVGDVTGVVGDAVDHLLAAEQKKKRGIRSRRKATKSDDQ